MKKEKLINFFDCFLYDLIWKSISFYHVVHSLKFSLFKFPPQQSLHLYRISIQKLME